MRYLLLILSFFSFIIANDSPDSFYDAFKYRNIGPTRGGRVTAIDGVDKTPGIFYMGATGGGLFKTSDFGITWKNINIVVLLQVFQNILEHTGFLGKPWFGGTSNRNSRL